ncbi:MAG: radical SAM protein, partial [Hadesarchaea archaeon]
MFLRHAKGWRAKCEVCGREAEDISATLKVCAPCVREHFNNARPHLEAAHAKVRERYNLPARVPKDPKGVRCGACGSDCRIPEGSKGFCGIIENLGGKLVRKFGTPERGLLTWYYDPLPTNCVPAEFCAGSG